MTLFSLTIWKLCLTLHWGPATESQAAKELTAAADKLTTALKGTP